MLSNSVTFKMTSSYVGPDRRVGRYEMDADGPFGERALLLFTVTGSELISVLYKMRWSLFHHQNFY